MRWLSQQDRFDRPCYLVRWPFGERYSVFCVPGASPRPAVFFADGVMAVGCSLSDVLADAQRLMAKSCG